MDGVETVLAGSGQRFCQMLYNTQIAMRPTRPSDPRALMIAVMLAMTSTFGKNGIAKPLNITPATIMSASTLTRVSARAPAHFFMVPRISISSSFVIHLRTKYYLRGGGGMATQRTANPHNVSSNLTYPSNNGPLAQLVRAPDF